MTLRPPQGSRRLGSPATGGPSRDLANGLPAGIGNPARNACATVGIVRLDQLTAWSRAELLALHGVGPKAVRILEAALAERGMALRTG